MKWFKRQVLGVDLGSRVVKGVKLKKMRDGRVGLENYFFQDLTDVMENVQDEKTRKEAIQALIEVRKLNQSESACTVQDREVMLLTLELPHMSEKELAEVVPAEAAEQGGLNESEYSFDFLMDQGVQNENGGLVPVKTYCVRKELVLNRMKELKALGLKAKSIEPEMMAISSMLNFNEYLKSDEVSVVIDIGDTHISTALIVGGEVLHTRHHDIAFGQINQLLMDRFSMTFKDAEKAKIEFNFMSPPKDGNPEVNQLLDEQFTEIFKALKESIDFYKETPESYGRVDRVFLLGGGSQLESLAQGMETIFQISAVVVNPFRNIDIFQSKDASLSQEELARIAPYMGTAVGLALSSIEEAA